MSQLEDDIDNRIKERLAQWIRDSYALYEMAELSKIKCGASVSFAMLAALAGVLSAYRIPMGETIRLLLKMRAVADSHRDGRETISLGDGND